MTNLNIIKLFKRAAAVLDLKNGNFFRVRAYQNAIVAIENLDEELKDIVDRGELGSVPNIGKELGDKITDLVTHGSSPALEKLFATVPAGMFELLDIPGLGPRKAHRLTTEFHLDDPKTAISKLKAAAKAHQIRLLEGFGEKSEQLILENLENLKPKGEVRMLLPEADQLAANLITFLKQLPEVQEASAMGSLRRRKDTIGDIDIVVATTAREPIAKALKTYPKAKLVKVEGGNVIRLITAKNRQLDVKFADPQEFGATLQHFTGSKLHNIALRELALSKGLSLSEHGIKVNGQLEPVGDEPEFYSRLGLPWIPPELRENEGEIEAAQSGKLPQLLDMSQVKGDFHTHTNYPWTSSHDYGGSLSDLLDQAASLGYEWLAIGDHNPSQSSYTPAQLVSEVKKRTEWVQTQYENWKKRVKNSTLKVFITLEIDITPSGELALPNKAVNYLDFAIVSIHSNLQLNHDLQTARLLKALSHPKVKILGHPTGRLLPDRPPLNAHWQTVFTHCASRAIALEINAAGQRLDLPDSLVRQAKALGCTFSLGTDAHQAEHLTTMPYAVDVARRGWCDKGDIINTLSYGQVLKWIG